MFEPTQSWYEPEIERETPEDHGYIHQDALPDVAGMRDWLTGVVEAMYKTGDVMEMERCLDELCHELNVPMIAADPAVETKNKNRKMHWYLGYQRATIEQMTTHRKTP